MFVSFVCAFSAKVDLKSTFFSADVLKLIQPLLQMRGQRRWPVTTLQQPVLRSTINSWNLAHMFVSTPYFHRGAKICTTQ